MNPIKAPITLGQTGAEVSNLQEILLAFISNNILSITDDTLVNRLADEYSKKLFGDATASLIKAFRLQEDEGDPTNGNVDADLAALINSDLASLQNQEHISISGRVQSASGSPLTGIYNVAITDIVNQPGIVLATVTTATDGSFSYTYTAAQSTINKKGYSFSVKTSDDAATLLATQTAYEFGSSIRIEITLPEVTPTAVTSEYEAITASLLAVLNRPTGPSAPTTTYGIETIDITDTAQMDLLIQLTGESQKLITTLAGAVHLYQRLPTEDPAISAENIYGLLRQNLPADPASLVGQPKDVLSNALMQSSSMHITSLADSGSADAIAASIITALITLLTTDLSGQDLRQSAFYRIINAVLSDTDTRAFLEKYYSYDPASDSTFWEYLGSAFASSAADLKAAVTLSLITGTNPALVYELMTEYKSQENDFPVWLTSLSEAAITDMISDAATTAASSFFYPDDVAGANTAAKNQDYAKRIFVRIGSFHPTHVIANAITGDSGSPFTLLHEKLDDFIAANPAFDIRTVPAARLAPEESPYHLDEEVDKAAFISELAIVQRLMRLTPSYPVIAAMKADGLHSSMQIAQQSKENFVETYSEAAGSDEEAGYLYDLAAGTSLFALTAMIEQMSIEKENIDVLPNHKFSITGAGAAYADWRSLFGPLDSCNCSQCQSVYSPAAYLTDLLQFLKTQTPDLYASLKLRRPDIKDIELTCKNTNTPVPHIDIVNELLEDLASSVIYSGGTYKLYARQTIADAASQRAIPEYVNTLPDPGMEVTEWVASANATDHVKTPYNALRTTTYPWTLPYNFYKRQIETHLDIAGVKTHEVSQRFSDKDTLQAWDDAAYCGLYLGISNEERAVIVNDPLGNTGTANAVTATFYGALKGATWVAVPDPAIKGASFATTATGATGWQTVITGRVDIFLQQTGLSYVELLQLLDCYTINAQDTISSRKMEILPKTGAAVDTCDLSLLYIDGVTLDVLSRLYRLVRLKRALGWTYYELDKALISLKPNTVTDEYDYDLIPIDEDNFKALVQMKRLTGLLNLSVAEVAAFGKDADNLPYRNYEKTEPQDIPGEYVQLFRNPLLAKLDAVNYPFKDSPVATSSTAADLQDAESYLAGILKIDGAELKQLLVSLYPSGAASGYTLPATTGSSILPVLSNIRREVLLLKSLNLSAAEWKTTKKWITNVSDFGTGTDPVYEQAAAPFATPFDTLRFIDFTRASQNAGVSISQVEYLLQDTLPDVIAEEKNNSLLATTLTKLRTELQKTSFAPYDVAADGDGKVLQALLHDILTESDAGYLVKVLRDDEAISGDSSAVRAAFLTASTGFFLSSSEQLAMRTYTSTEDSRKALLYGKLKTYVETTVRPALIVSFLAKEFGLKEEVADTLLHNCIEVTVSGTPDPAIDLFTDLAYINDQSAIVRWTPTGVTNVNADAFTALLRVQKAAWLINTFKLGLTDVTYLWDEQAIPGIPQLSALPVTSVAGTPPTLNALFYQWLIFLRWMQVRDFLGKDSEVLYTAIRNLSLSSGAATKAATFDSIRSVFKIGLEDAETLLGDEMSATVHGVLQATFNADYKNPRLYLRIIDCLEIQHLLPSAMAALADIAASVNAPDDQDKANKVIQVVKAQYDDEQWPGVIRPVNDLLRTERRDALVAYLLSNPPTPYINYWFTSNDLFETLMLDVDMMSCMATTRILLAINTVQLWVDRVLLGLESGLVLTAANARQWHMWRKLYRVWEANRKIFIYPENWIEPDLRDGKSPFFIELEKFLKQNELTDSNVEDAYRTYLERLDEVAHLDVVGMYRETTQTNYGAFTYAENVTDRDTIHVFGRTKAQPHIYFYRKRVADEWTPWEKMDVQIDGEHFIPVIWRGRLRFYWLVFTTDQGGDAATNTRLSNDYITPASSRWKINLAWTEYKNGKWSAKQMSKEALYSFAIEEENLKTLEQLNYYLKQDARGWYPKGTSERQKRERISFFCFEEADGELRFQIKEKIVRNSTSRLYNQLILGYYGFPAIQTNVSAIDVNSQIAKAILLIDSTDAYNDVFGHTPGSFKIRYNGAMAIEGLGLDNVNHLYQLDMDNTLGFEGQNYKPRDSQYQYLYPSLVGYAHYPDMNVKLLNLSPDKDQGKKDGKYLTFPRQLPKNYVSLDPYQIPYFFYKDYDNSFFVEKVTHMIEGTGLAVMTSGGTNGGRTMYAPGQWSSEAADGMGPVLASGSRRNYFYLAPAYRFHSFSHSKVDQFQEKLYAEGLDGLLDRNFITAGLPDTMQFAGTYAPTVNVDRGTSNDHVPVNSIDFRTEAAYSLYNWELFFHIPMLIANKLSQDQKFEEARRWYHYVFNPTVGGATSPSQFWNFPQFYYNATTVAAPQDLMSDPNLAADVARWANDPFKPHLIARTRISAYMKNTVMKYLDNLIAWADNLYGTDTRENINEATLLYVLAAQLLGRKPLSIPARAVPAVQTYASLEYGGNLNAFSNALVQVENFMLASGATIVSSGSPGTSILTGKSMYYFCMIPNDKLAGYWDTIADRLFKIRHCQSIDGVERELALFDPPIDPALLVKAAAAGISIADAVAGINAPLPSYRFNVMSQKATELAGEVKALGSQLLSALEKKDAEHLALLRSSQEAALLDAMTEIKTQSIEESVAQINALGQQQTMTTQRRDFYQRVVDGGLNAQEQLNLDSMQFGLDLQIYQGASKTLAAALHSIPDVMIGAFSAGAQYGGGNLGNSANVGSDIFAVTAGINSTIGSMAATKGSFARRKDEWNLQLKTSNTELKQIEQQLLSARIRKAMAEVELRNHQLQVQHNAEMDTAMREKYTNEELYDWMTGQLSFTYFQAYKLALDMAKRAERCYHYELPASDDTMFIAPTYWDSLRKGLLAGEQLSYDIKRMEASYLDKNKRQLELSKHISLSMLSPQALIDLKSNKTTTVNIPEWLFDLDYPGQHMRRIKSVSISIPCVAGPYTTVSCKLSLLKSQYRKAGTKVAASDYNNADKFNYQYGSIQSIATSHAQNDSGMFEFSFRDERYLPFEGSGAISTWKIELPSKYAQFDYDSIQDVILHVNYTALDEGGLKDVAGTVLHGLMNPATSITGGSDADIFYRLFDLKHEFPNEWYAMLNGTDHKLVLQGLKSRLPYLAQAGAIASEASFIVERKDATTDNLAFALTTGTTATTVDSGAKVPSTTAASSQWWSYNVESPSISSTWSTTIKKSGVFITADDVKNMYLLVQYKIDVAL